MNTNSERGSKLIPVAPMLAEPGDSSQLAAQGWAMEMKWDGIRAIAELFGGGARLWSRNGIDISVQFPAVLQEMGTLASRNAIVDGELVVFDSEGRPNFELVQLSRSQTASEAKLKAHYMAFDVMSVDDVPIVDLTYDERRRALEALSLDGAYVHVPPIVGDDIDLAVAKSSELGLEGVVAKRRASSYAAGRRSSDWIKIKHTRTQEAVVGGWLSGKGRRSHTIGSLLLGVPSGGAKLRYIGRVGTGLNEADLRQIALMVQESASASSPFTDVPLAVQAQANWIEPRLVCEIQLSGWTQSGLLRHPTWRGWRFDKQPWQVVVEG